LSNLQLSARTIRPGGRLTATVEVENTGKRPGDEVVQLYIRDVAANVTRPVKELKGFARITLKPGEKRRVEFQLTPELLGSYNRQMLFVVEPGEFRVFAATSSVDGLEARFEVVEE
jgi:beta-glucosidase